MFSLIQSQASTIHKKGYKRSSCLDQTICLPGLKVFSTIIIGGFESSATKNTKQPVKNDICQAAHDLALIQHFPSFDFLTFTLNQDGHDTA